MLKAARSSWRGLFLLGPSQGNWSPGDHHSFSLVLCTVLIANTAPHISLAYDCGCSPSVFLYISPSLCHVNVCVCLCVCVCACIYIFAYFLDSTDCGRQGSVLGPKDFPAPVSRQC